MGLMNSKRFFSTNVKNCNLLVGDFKSHFEAQGYTVTSESLGSDTFLSMTKGNMFQAIAGMKTGLNINLKKENGGITAEMEVGLFGKQAIATAISMLVAWPVLIPQIIGLVKQNKLDEEAYSVIENAIKKIENADNNSSKYCENCGAKLPEGALFCVDCGTKVESNVCPRCGQKFPAGSKFCPNCGEKI